MARIAVVGSEGSCAPVLRTRIAALDGHEVELVAGADEALARVCGGGPPPDAVVVCDGPEALRVARGVRDARAGTALVLVCEPCDCERLEERLRDEPSLAEAVAVRRLDDADLPAEIAGLASARQGVRSAGEPADLAALPVAALRVSPEGLLLGWNRRAAELFAGCELRSGGALADLYPPAERRRVGALLRAVGERGSPPPSRVLERVDAEGQAQHTELSAATAPDADGGPAVTVVAVDVTARVAAEDARSRAECLLDAQYRIAGALASAAGVEEALPPLLEALGRGFDAEWAAYWTVRPAIGALALGGRWQRTEALAEFAKASEDETVPRGVGLVGRAWSAGAAEAVAGSAGAELGRGGAGERAGLRRALAAPVRRSGEVVGVLELADGSSAPLRRDALGALEAVALQLGRFLESAAGRAAVEHSQARRERALAGMLRAEEAERVRVAAGLHDDTVQSIAASLVALDLVTAAAQRGESQRAAASAERAREILESAMEETRELLFELRPPLLDQGGLAPAVRALAAEAAVAGGFEASVEGDPGRHGWAAEELAYRLVQGALANAAQHAGAARVRVELEERHGALAGRVSDDGAGFDVTAPERAGTPPWSSLAAMSERVRVAGGEVELDSRPGRGTTVSFSIPSDAGEREPEGSRAARALAEDTQEWLSLLETLVSAAPVGFGFWDRNLRYVRLNEALADMSGLSVAEHLGQTVAEMLPDAAESVEPLLREVLASGEERTGLEVVAETAARPGEPRAWRLSAYPVQLGGETIGVGAVSVEVTLQKRAEAQRERLLDMAGGLARAVSLEDVTSLAIEQGIRAIGARAGLVALIDEPVGELVVSRAIGYGSEDIERSSRLPLELDAPLTLAARTGEPVFVETAAEWGERFAAAPVGGLPATARVAVPLAAADGHAIGAMGFTFDRPITFSEADRRLVVAVGQQCALALQRSQVYEAEREAHRRAAFLAEASSVLNESLASAATLDRLAHAALAGLADWCAIDELEDEGFRTVAVAHEDHALEPLILRLLGDHPTHDRARRAALGRRSPQRYARLSLDDLPLERHAPEDRPALERLAPRSAIVAPLVVAGRALGTMTLVRCEPGRPYTSDDAALASELADRAAIALENARVYEERSSLAADLMRLSVISDVALSHLDLDQLLEALLGRLVEVLAIDRAVILLADDESQALTVRAAVGLEEEVAAGVRVPVGRGFAGTIAATREPRIVEDVSTIEVISPYLRELTRSLMGVPLVVEERLIGVLEAGTSAFRDFSTQDLRLLQLAGDRAALAIRNAQLYAEQRNVADTLQGSLLAPPLPRIPGAELAARYRPLGRGIDVGGDFYDAFPTPEGDWAVVVGDVSGKGAGAAAVTGIVRHTIRAVAAYRRGAEGALAAANDAMLRQPSERFCTAALARLRHDGRVVRADVRVAGHPPPLVLRADGGVEALDVFGDVLGMFEDARVGAGVCSLGPGDAMLLYTDGVTEARARGELFGERRLHDVLVAARGRSAEELLDAVLEAVDAFADRQRDDVAMLAIRVPP